MIFISLGKVRKKLTKEAIAEVSKAMEKWSEEGVKFLNIYYTLGSYDVVAIFDAPDEKTAMRGLMRLGDIEDTETLVAIPREEATKLIE
jgi:uncharacterized protein with GYD domain